MNKQITVTLTLDRAEAEFALGDTVPDEYKNEVVLKLNDTARSQLRSALQSEQKPVEPKTVVLGPDTPLGWYKVCDKDATGKEQYNYLRDKVELVEHGFIDDKTVAMFRSPVGHFSLRYGIGLIEPVAPPAPASKCKTCEGRGWVERTETFDATKNVAYSCLQKNCPACSPVPAPVAEVGEDELAQSQIDRLAKFLTEEFFPEYPNANEGAADTAIRIIRRSMEDKGFKAGWDEGRSDLQREYEAKLKEVKV
ncbi:MAG: hypothetical protein JSS75_07285 [Bacteroidetes bacterium]|nr:hypothetical protein [Bacteroidota bacterium]